MIQLIYAYCGTKNAEGHNEYAFGLKDGLPWGHIKRDMQNFARHTKDSILIMGAKTFMGFKEPLPGRITIVVQDMSRPLATTKHGFLANCYISKLQLNKLLTGSSIQAKTSYNCSIPFNPTQKYSVIGGKGILEMAQPYADRIIQTSIRKKHYVCSDVKLDMNFIVFPSWSDDFQTVESSWVRCDELTSITETIYERV
ncbi:hypothetical protein CkP1_0254 [Citrobacter phage CkP1]|nr:hypothetical protein CkP1_0254 [Citrobacter phage CkP1]